MQQLIDQIEPIEPIEPLQPKEPINWAEQIMQMKLRSFLNEMHSFSQKIEQGNPMKLQFMEKLNEMDQKMVLLVQNPSSVQTKMELFEIVENLNKMIIQQSFKPKKVNRIKVLLIGLVVKIHEFFKDDSNISKCILIALNAFFMSAYIQIPKQTNILDWLAYNRNSRQIMLTGTLCLMAYFWKITSLLYDSLVQIYSMTESEKMKILINECNPFLGLSLVFMADGSLMRNKFDLAVWIVNYFLFAVLKVYNIQLFKQIKNISSQLTNQNFQIVYNTVNINNFTIVIILLAITYFLTLANYLYDLGFYTLFLLFFLNIQCIIDYIQLHSTSNALRKNYIYYINNNIDQIHEPNFIVDILCDTIQHILRIFYNSLLISNIQFSYQVILHLWMFYILSDMQHSLAKLKDIFYAIRAYYKIQHTLKKTIPQDQEICSICHEELLVARALQCGHIFHFKCIYNWLKSQPQCPICRQQVNGNIFEQNNSIFSQILNFFSNITLLNITIYFSREEQVQQEQPEQQQQQMQEQGGQQDDQESQIDWADFFQEENKEDEEEFEEEIIGNKYQEEENFIEQEVKQIIEGAMEKKVQVGENDMNQ